MNWDQKIEGMNNDQIVAKDPAGGAGNAGAGTPGLKTMQILQVSVDASQNRTLTKSIYFTAQDIVTAHHTVRVKN